MDQIKTLGVAEMAVILKLSPATIQLDLSRAPHKLPPRISRPGRPIWLADTVYKWLSEEPMAKQKQLKKRGRPPKILEGQVLSGVQK